MFPRISSTLSWICLRNPEQNKATIPNQSIPQVVDFPFVKEKNSANQGWLYSNETYEYPHSYIPSKNNNFSQSLVNHISSLASFSHLRCVALPAPARRNLWDPRAPLELVIKVASVTCASGWWCDVPILKNDGVKVNGKDDIPYITWKILENNKCLKPPSRLDFRRHKLEFSH